MTTGSFKLWDELYDVVKEERDQHSARGRAKEAQAAQICASSAKKMHLDNRNVQKRSRAEAFKRPPLKQVKERGDEARGKAAAQVEISSIGGLFKGVADIGSGRIIEANAAASGRLIEANAAAVASLAKTYQEMSKTGGSFSMRCKTKTAAA